MKASRNGAGKDNKKETEMGGENLGKLSKTEPKTTMVSTSDSIKASIVLEACEASTEYGDNSKVKRSVIIICFLRIISYLVIIISHHI